MNAMKSLGRELIRTVVICGLVFGAVPPGGAQEQTKAQEANKKTGAAQAPGTQAQTLKPVESPARGAEKSSKDPQEGIKVHGDWVIVIRNEDGSVASRHEFHNSLYSPSPLLILLARNGVVLTQGYTIAINLSLQQPPGQPQFPNADRICNGPCFIVEPPGQDSSDQFYNLSVTATSNALILAGRAKAISAGRISIVGTRINLSTNRSFVDFTARDLTQPDPPSSTPPPVINVVANQTIDVTVTISFS